MKYIIMCGGEYAEPIPKQLFKVNGEELTARTIRLLKQEGIEDISISSNNLVFDKFGIPRLEHVNTFGVAEDGKLRGLWVEAFYPLDEPACYVFGDVLFSDKAIHKIVTTETNDVEFFASAPPFGPGYPKSWAEPFAFKVVNQEHFREAIEKTKELKEQGKFVRHPISWELWQVIKDTPINCIDFSNYTAINDYTCDIDHENQIAQWRIRI